MDFSFYRRENLKFEILAGFLGHDVKIHSEYYRLPKSTTQVAKVGKLLMLMEKGGVVDFAGQANIEIDLNCNPFSMLTY